VPIAALVALASGGYGVQVVQGASTHYAAVKTGLFAGGKVEISGADIDEGTTVGVPSS
jgi:multidrug efflux system membrane fusion protein